MSFSKYNYSHVTHSLEPSRGLHHPQSKTQSPYTLGLSGSASAGAPLPLRLISRHPAAPTRAECRQAGPGLLALVFSQTEAWLAPSLPLGTCPNATV